MAEIKNEFSIKIYQNDFYSKRFYYFCSMSWIKKIIVGIVVLLVIFAFSKYYVIEQSEKVKVEKELSFPLAKIFSQYNNLQNFVRWNEDVLDTKELFIHYYQPYQGAGSAMSYRNKKGSIRGELSIVKEKEEKSITYQFFSGNKAPLYINVFFTKISEDATKVTYVIEKPAKTIWEKAMSYWKEEPTFFMMDKEVNRLESVLSNKIDKEKWLTNITYDSIMVENQPEQLLLGKYFSVMNRPNMVTQKINKNIAQLQQYVQVSLEKKSDEYGFPTLIKSPHQTKNKQLSYYVGIPLSQSMKLEEKQYGFRNIASSKTLSIYYKGNYHQANNTVKRLIKRAKKDSMRYGEVQQIFLKTPKNSDDVMMKIILPISK